MRSCRQVVDSNEVSPQSTLSWTNAVSSPTPCKSCALLLSPPLLPTFGHILFLSPAYILEPKTSQRSPAEAAQMLRYSGTITSFDQLAILCLTHPRKGLALLATRHIVGLYWTYHQPKPLDPFLEGCTPASCPPIHTYVQASRIILSQLQNPAFVMQLYCEEKANAAFKEKPETKVFSATGHTKLLLGSN